MTIAIKTGDHTADTSALERSVPREQGSRIRHSRPENSAAPASRLQEVVGSERGEGTSPQGLAHRNAPLGATRCSSRLATLHACGCHTARTVAVFPSLPWGQDSLAWLV